MTWTAPQRLPAKSARGAHPPLSLPQHSFDAEQAAAEVFRLDRRWGDNYCRFFGLDDSPQKERFLRHLRVASLFHDIGKANADFINLVLERRGAQTVRHEHLSGLLLCLPQVRAWLEDGDLDADVITAAVLSHHLKVTRQEHRYNWCQPRSGPQVALALDHPDVAAILDRVRQVADLPQAPQLPNHPWHVEDPLWTGALSAGLTQARRLQRNLRKDVPRNRLLLAVKAALIAADSVASAMVREGHPITAWIDDVAHGPRITEAKVHGSIIEPRLRSIPNFAWQDFQTEVGLQPERTLLLAACGAGKTLAAWRWAAAQSQQRALGKVVFLYPTRGTATEGFRDYVGWAPEADAALMHGSSRYELEKMRDNPSEALSGKDLTQIESDQRLFALGFWSKRFFSATVDQFLSFLEHRYDSLCLLPVLADAAVVIDEVHSFSPAMFQKLLSFLKFFKGPVLCMTATLPTSRIKQLEHAGMQVFPRDAGQFSDLAARERKPRYSIQLLETSQPPVEVAVEAYRAGKRVLWVVNTVARCQAVARALERCLGEPVTVYHSRFLLGDRQSVHQRTIEAFKQEGKPALAITTQVCEMSLDLDAEVLITELAPFTALVQRLGRSNRHLRYESSQVWVYEPEAPAPYSAEELEASRSLLDTLVGERCSQAQLASALERYEVDEQRHPEDARFIESGYFALPGSFREDDDYSQQVILDADLQRVQERQKRKVPIDDLTLAVPRRFAWATEGGTLPPYLQLASAERYDQRLGFITDDEVLQ